MIYDHILIRYGELGLKGKNRHLFIDQLHRNLKNVLATFPDVKVSRARDRMYVVLNGQHPEPVIRACQKGFGIYSMSLAMKVENKEESIKAGALKALNNAKDAKTFKVNVRRAYKKFPVSSQEMNRLVGAHLLKNTTGISVDVHEPDVEIRIEIRENGTFIYSEVIDGARGLPVGTGGKTLLMLSGGIDSPVAGYLMMKRGVEVEMIHFHSPPFTSERAKQKVLDLTGVLSQYGGPITLNIVPFTKLQQKIFREIPNRYGMTVMRRVMFKIAEKVCERRGILSIATGESLGQVASQTMASMNVINEVTNLPVIRPLVAFDKEEIVNIAKKIGTYEISIRPYEDCCTIFVPSSPVTNPTRKKVNALEAGVDFSEEIEEALRNIEVLEISHAQTQKQPFSDLL